MGGTLKTRNMYRDIYLNKYVQGDVIQETYLNTPSAWVNMLLLGSNGPIKTPVGACDWQDEEVSRWRNRQFS